MDHTHDPDTRVSTAQATPGSPTVVLAGLLARAGANEPPEPMLRDLLEVVVTRIESDWAMIVERFAGSEQVVASIGPAPPIADLVATRPTIAHQTSAGGHVELRFDAIGEIDVDTIHVLHAVTVAAAGIVSTDHIRLERERLERQLLIDRELDRILSALALRLVDSDTTLAAEVVEEGLGAVGRLVSADRTYVFEFDHERETMSNTYEWCAPGIEPVKDMLQDLPLTMFPWAIEQLARREIIVALTEELPAAAAAEQAILVEQLVQGIIWIPLQREGIIVGFVGFDQVRGTWTWGELERDALRQLGAVLSLAIARFHARREADRSATQLHAIAARLDAALVITDARFHRGEFANPALEQLFGIETAEFLHNPAALVRAVHADDRVGLQRELRRLLWHVRHHRGEPIAFDQTVRVVVEDQLRWLRIRAFEIEGGHDEEPRAAALIDDVTSMRTLQEELTRALDRVAAASRAKSEFLAKMGHELRNPLQGALGYLELLRLDPDADDRDAYIAHAEESARRLDRLIGDTFEIAQVQRGVLRLNIVEFDLAASTRQTVEDHRAQLAERQLRVELHGQSEGLMVSTDPDRVTQVLANLLTNAAKYATPSTTVRVVIGGNGGTASIDVIDEGPGLTTEQVETIFIPFDRLGAERSPIAGSGIGLAFARQLAQRLGGDLSLRSTFGVGSTFRIELPVTASHPTAGAFVVLCVDDDDDDTVRSVVLTTLGRIEGCRVQSASNLQEAFTITAIERPDLVILDRHLLDGDGTDTIARFLAFGTPTRPLSVAVMSADDDVRARELAIRAGAIAYFVKPVELTELVEFVSDLAVAP